MGEPTMKKDDVKLEYDSLSAVDWAEIRQVVGSAAPATAKALFEEVSKKLKAKEIKKPYAKVGLVSGSMYLRFKDGNTHLGDTLLAKNWAPPANVPVDKASQKIADDFIASRKALQNTVEQGKTIIKTLAQQVAALRGNIETLLKDAQKDASAGKGSMDAVAEGAKLVSAVTKLAAQAHSQMDQQIFPVFSQHRTITKPDGVSQEQIDGWGKAFFLTVGTEFSKATHFLETIDNDLNQTQEAKLAIDRLSAGGQSAQQSKLDELKRVADEIGVELAAMQEALIKTRTIDELGDNIRRDNLAGIKAAFDAGDTKLALANADTATVKVQKAAANYKIMETHFGKLNALATVGNKLGKEFGSSPAAKTLMQDIARQVSAAKTFASEQQGYLKDGVAAYGEVKKLLSAKGQKAA